MSFWNFVCCFSIHYCQFIVSLIIKEIINCWSFSFVFLACKECLLCNVTKATAFSICVLNLNVTSRLDPEPLNRYLYVDGQVDGWGLPLPEGKGQDQLLLGGPCSARSESPVPPILTLSARITSRQYSLLRHWLSPEPKWQQTSGW